VLVSVPSEDSELFFDYFCAIWEMEVDESWRQGYEKEQLIQRTMSHYHDNASSACFLMLCNAHDIIYDRTY
jgi:predicted restriction endonuclease